VIWTTEGDAVANRRIVASSSLERPPTCGCAEAGCGKGGCGKDVGSVGPPARAGDGVVVFSARLAVVGVSFVAAACSSLLALGGAGSAGFAVCSAVPVTKGPLFPSATRSGPGMSGVVDAEPVAPWPVGAMPKRGSSPRRAPPGQFCHSTIAASTSTQNSNTPLDNSGGRGVRTHGPFGSCMDITALL